jgi:drug/metabolite transporter (DMT)-like permease
MTIPSVRTAAFTTAAMIAFAANSVLCRLALAGGAIDAAGFTTLRLFSGAIALLLISASVGTRPVPRGGNWISAFLLFLYAAAFSFAYLGLTAGTGALILFGSVQATMLISALWSGERPHLFEWLGLMLALSGLIYLVLPGLSAPPLLSSILMVAAGISWGLYSIRGRGGSNPLADTTGNFVRSLPFAVVLFAGTVGETHFSRSGILLALASGAITSGVGYVIWYAALRGLSATRAATVQLAVPVIAAAGGVVFLSENVTLRLIISAILILGGIGLAVSARRK